MNKQEKIRFVNIKTGEIFTFDSWDNIIKIGGLSSCLPKEQWSDIWNEKAASENTRLYFTRHNKHSINDSIKALQLFENE